MDRRSLTELRDELTHLMQEHIASFKDETFGGLCEDQLCEQEERLKRIREVSADFLAALKRIDGSTP